jgi:Tol biopolymer transport system component
VAGQGALSVVSATDATPVGAGLIPLPSGVFGTMPDWAPDGKHLAFAAITSGDKARHLHSSSIAWLSADGDSFSNYEVVAQSKLKSCGDNTEAYANPMFSPDSQWLAFSRADCESEGDPTAEIVLARAEPNAEQFRLELANTQVGDQKVDHLQNGMPTWAPALDGKIGWIAFTSTRDYGLVLNAENHTGPAMRQLWVAAVDLSKAGQADPSYPAFRLPAQDLTENNHRPFWAIDVLPPDWKPKVPK